MSPSPVRAILAGNVWCVVILFSILLFPQDGMAHAALSNKLKRLDGLIAHNPVDSELLIARAQVFSDQGDYERARLDLDLADMLGGTQKSTFTRAVMLYRMGYLEKSRLQLNRTLDAYPHNMEALEYRARVHRDLGSNSAAIADFRALIEAQDNTNPGYYLAAAKLMVTNDGGIEEALILLDGGMLRLGVIPQLQSYAVTLELRRGHTEAAINRNLSLRLILNDSPDWKVETAHMYTLHNQPDVALDYYRQAQLQLSYLRPTRARQELAASVEASIVQLQQRESTL
jgi:tetratricopeptide (TPR) repeat protein